MKVGTKHSPGAAVPSDDALRKQLTRFYRWHTLQRKVGWFAIVFCKAYAASAVNQGPDKAFNDFVNALVNFRPGILIVLEELWKHYPLFLEICGGINRFVLHADMHIDHSVGQLKKFLTHSHLSELEDEDDEGSSGDVLPPPSKDPTPTPEPSPPKPFTPNRVEKSRKKRPHNQIESEDASAPPTPDKRARTSVKKERNTPAAPPTKTTAPEAGTKIIPCWKWHDNSCSLDATALASLLMMIRLPVQTHLVTYKSPAAFVQLMTNFDDVKGGWERWNSEAMTAVRDGVRRRLEKEGILVSGRSSVEQTLGTMIPLQMRKIDLVLTEHCLRKVCRGKGVYARATTQHTDWIECTVMEMKDSSIQEMLDSAVLLPSDDGANMVQ